MPAEEPMNKVNPLAAVGAAILDAVEHIVRHAGGQFMLADEHPVGAVAFQQFGFFVAVGQHDDLDPGIEDVRGFNHPPRPRRIGHGDHQYPRPRDMGLDQHRGFGGVTGNGGDAAGAQVEELGGVDLAGRRAVRALHVVGFDLEAGQGIRFGVRREQEVAVRLVGVGALGVRGDLDEAREDRARLAEQGVLEEQVGLRVAGGVDLQRALVELLFARGDRDAVEADVGAGAVDAHGVLEARATGADGGVDGADDRVAAAAGIVDLEGLRGRAPGLDGEAADLRARAGVDVDGGDREGALVGLGGEVEVVDVGLGVFAGDDEGVRTLYREYAGDLAGTPEADAFEIVASGIHADGAAIRDVARAVARTDLMERFLTRLRTEMTAQAAAAPGRALPRHRRILA